MWSLSTQTYVSSFKEHAYGITNIRWESDCRLFLSSWDHTASIITLDEHFQYVLLIKFEGHTFFVNDILPLPPKQCVTCSRDRTIKVWDCETGACLRTLTEHTQEVLSLAMHTNRRCFASGSWDQSVLIWSSETFEVLHHMQFPSSVHSLLFVEDDAVYVGVYEHGVMSCSVLTGEIGRMIIPVTGRIADLSLRK